MDELEGLLDDLREAENVNQAGFYTATDAERRAAYRAVVEHVQALKEQRDALLAICEEIAHSKCDLGDSERRIRLYHAITQAGGKL